MKTYQFINFKLIEQKTETGVYQCCNNKSGNELGIIKWYTAWGQYCYFPSCPAVYSKGCLEDINDFIKQISKK